MSPPALIGIAAAAITGAIKARSAGKDRQAAKELETLHTTEPGFENFGEELAGEGGRNLSLSNVNRPVIFPNAPQDPNRRRF